MEISRQQITRVLRVAGIALSVLLGTVILATPWWIHILDPVLFASSITDLEGITGKIGKEDVEWGTGADADNFTITTYDGGTATLTTVPSPFADDHSRIKSVWYVSANSSILDHGTDSGADYASGNLKSIIDTVGASEQYIELAGHHDYTVATSVTVPANCVLRVHPGAKLCPQAGATVTINARPEAGLYPIFDLSGGGTVAVNFFGDTPVEWWGVSTEETAANNTTYGNAAIAALINQGFLSVNGFYDIDGALEVTISANHDTLVMIGNGWSTGFSQTDGTGKHIIEVTEAGAANQWTDIHLRDLNLVGSGALSGDGLKLRRVNGTLTNLKIEDVHGGTGVAMEGAIELIVSKVEVDGCDIGILVGCSQSDVYTNSANQCVLTGIRVRDCSGHGVLFQANAAKGLRPKGNLINGYDFGSAGVGTEKALSFQGGLLNTVIMAWVEQAKYGIYMTAQADGVYTQHCVYNTILYPYWTGDNMTYRIYLEDGSGTDGNRFIGGRMPGGNSTQVYVGTSCDNNLFDGIVNFPGCPTNESVVRAMYEWDLSAAGTDEYSLTLAGGGDPEIGTVFGVKEDGVHMTAGTAGALTCGEWAYADSGEGYTTVFVRLSDGDDPDNKANGYVYVVHSGGTYEDNGTNNVVRSSFAGGAIDPSNEYWSQYPAMRNGSNIRAFTSQGEVVPVLGVSTNDVVALYDYKEDAALRVTKNDELILKHALCMEPKDTTSTTLSGHTDFTRVDGSLFFLDTEGDNGYQFNPVGTFTAGHTIIIHNVDAKDRINFDNGGLEQIICHGESALFTYDGEEWKGGIISDIAFSTDDTATPPTDAQLDTAFGEPTSLREGFCGVLDDAGAGVSVYFVTVADGDWWHVALTKAL